jgi:hypothetical protein
MELFVAAFLALPFALFAVLCALRRARFRALATALGADHHGANPFAPGTIRGQGYTIELEKVGKAYRTLVRRDGPTPGTFLLRARFFERFPDWSAAFVPGLRQERVFLWELALRAFVEPAADEQRALLAWLGPAAGTGVAQALRRAALDEIHVTDGHVSASLRGIVTSSTRLRAVLEALALVAPHGAAGATRRAS